MESHDATLPTVYCARKSCQRQPIGRYHIKCRFVIEGKVTDYCSPSRVRFPDFSRCFAAVQKISTDRALRRSSGIADLLSPQLCSTAAGVGSVCDC